MGFDSPAMSIGDHVSMLKPSHGGRGTRPYHPQSCRFDSGSLTEVGLEYSPEREWSVDWG